MPRHELNLLAEHRFTGFLGACAERNEHVGTDTEAKVVPVAFLIFVEDHARRMLELHKNFGRGDGQALSSTDVDRYTRPAPVVDMQAQRGECFHLRVGGDTRLVAVATELASHDVAGRQRPHGFQRQDFLISNSVGIAGRGRFHGTAGLAMQEKLCLTYHPAHGTGC